MEFCGGNRLSLCIGALLTVGMLSGCGGGGSSSPSAVNAPTAEVAVANAFTAELTGTGVYTDGLDNQYVGKIRGATLASAAFSSYSLSGVNVTPNTISGWYLNDSGQWLAANSAAMVDNGNGTITMQGTTRLTPATMTDLSGQTVNCTSTCASAQTYPNGAKSCIVNAEVLLDGVGLGAQQAQFTDLNGNAFTSLPATGLPGYCAASSGWATIFQLNGTAYDVHSASNCNPSSITTALTNTPDVSGVIFSQGGRNGVSIIKVNIPAYSGNAASLVGLAYVNGAFWAGKYTSAGTPQDPITFYNRSAINARAAANGLGSLP